MLLKIIFDNLTKKNLLKFNANWIDESMKMKNVCFASSKVSREFIKSTLNMIIMMYVAYRCLQNDDETFEKSEIEIRNDVLKFYRNLASSSYFSIEFSAKLFSFSRRFLATIKTSIFFAIDDVIIDRRLWNFSTMRIKLNQLLNQNTSKSFVKKIRTNILKIMSEFLKMIKKAKKLCFEINSFWAAKIATADTELSASSRTSQTRIKSKNRSSQSFISRSFLSLSKNVVFAFIAFEFSKDLKTNSRLQTFRAMRRSAFIIEIFDSSSDDMKKLRESDRRQLFHHFEKDVSFDKSSSSSE